MQIELEEKELEQYSSQLLVSNWGLKEQLALKNSSIILQYENEITALYLAGAGIGKIYIKDQILGNKIKALNPLVKIKTDFKKAEKNSYVISYEKENTNSKTKLGLHLALKAIKEITRYCL